MDFFIKPNVNKPIGRNYNLPFFLWGFIKSSGSVLSTNPFRIELQSPKMEVDGLDVTRFIAKAATADFDALDATIHTLRRPVACLQHDGIENAPQMLLDDASHLFDRSQATADGPGIPLAPPFFSPGATDIVPELHGERLDRPGPCGFQRTGSQHLEGTLPLA